MNTYDHDAIVIGGSFAGLSAAMQLARARRRVCVVDAGQPRNRIAAASHGFFGQDGEPPLAMIEQARRKLLAYPTVTLRQGTVVSATSKPDAGASTASGFDVVLDDGAGALTPLTTRKLVLAFGVKDGLPDIAGLRERWGASVLHCPTAMATSLRASGWACCTTRRSPACTRSSLPTGARPPFS